jgi:formylglycine-generating enzyme required for sulfatase activity
MTSSALSPASGVDLPSIWQAPPALLSVALMDARNHTLHLLSAFEAAQDSGNWRWQAGLGQEPPLWLAGHAGWFAEYWIGRNTRRALGLHCPSDPLRLPSIDPDADRLRDPTLRNAQQRAVEALPERARVRAWLLDTLEATLELLERQPHEDAALYFFRLALFHEDLLGERLIRMAQTQGLTLNLAPADALVPRAPMGINATHWAMPQTPTGFAPEGHPGRLELRVPDFEIDAQPVSWAQYIEFVDDGGYDRPECWHPDGWAWLQALDSQGGRRAPRHVEQIGVARMGSGGAVLQQRFGQRVRLSSHQPVIHVSWWEADAWCRWAGRRLPDEAEWDLAAHSAARRGFRWGGVREWTASRLRPWPGAQPGPWRQYAWPWLEVARVQRGHGLATRARLCDSHWRWFALPGDDEDFVGFRSCAA